MISKFSTKPIIIKTNFRLVDSVDKSIYSGPFVAFWFDIEAKGIKFSSEGNSAQCQHLGKFLIGPPEHEEHQFWSDETVAKLSVPCERWRAVTDNYLAARNDPSFSDTPSLSADLEQAEQQLESVENEMATSDFFDFYHKIAILLKCEDSRDERAYALYRGTVWSCARELEPEQWSLLADRFIEQEDVELAAALAGGESSLTRERISTAVRRAVWIRDQGKCARCGSRERLEYDHIVPESRGGGNTERNVELLCEVCNRAKSDAIA